MSRPSQRVRTVTEFGNSAGCLSVNLILDGESLAGHPQQRLLRNSIAFWRTSAALGADKIRFGCQRVFGREVAIGAFLVATGSTDNTSAAVAGLCVACLVRSDDEIDHAAAKTLRRAIPHGRWLDPRPTQKAVRA